MSSGQVGSLTGLIMNAILPIIRDIVGFTGLSTRALVLKAVLYRLFSVIFTFFLAFVLTENFALSLSATLFEMVVKTLMYYGFEVGWSNFQKKL